MMSPKRDSKIDLAKAIGIILVVLGHAGAPHSSIFFRFHMALFFVLSGYCFRDNNLDSIIIVGKYILKKIKSLYIPFVLFNLGTLLCRNIFISLNIYTDNEDFLSQPKYGWSNSVGLTSRLPIVELKPYVINILKFSGESQLGGATWFLRVLFWLSVTWIIIQFIIKKIIKFSDDCRMIINILISIIMMIIATIWMNNSVHFITQYETVVDTYWLFTLGYYIRNFKSYDNKILTLVISIIAFIILLKCDSYCTQQGWNSNVNLFDNPFMFIVSSLAGSICVLFISSLITIVNRIKITEYIGRHTLSILMWHFMAFKIVVLMQILIYEEPMYRLASFPVYFSGKHWWILYSLVGISIPLLVSFIYDRISELLKIKIN